MLNTTTGQEFAAETEPAPAEATPQALRAQVAERLAAHRRRRGDATQSANPEPARSSSGRSAQIAAAVAERYAHTQSYRAFLAAEAERATQQARAAAEVAAVNAQAVAAAQQRLLEAFDEHASRNQEAQAEAAGEGELHGQAHTEQSPAARVEPNLWPELDKPSAAENVAQQVRVPRRATTASQPTGGTTETKPKAVPAAGLTVRLYEDASSASHVELNQRSRVYAGHTNRSEERNEADAWALDEEIAFRQSPVFEEPAGPPVPLPANLIEFPRQLVAARKARPRYAEGPLRDEDEAAPGDGQLRIFEVDPAQISTTPEADDMEAPSAQWTSIWLDTPEVTEVDDHAPLIYGPVQDFDALPAQLAQPAPALQPATLQRRMLAGAVNVALISAAMIAAVATFVATSARGISIPGDGSWVHALRQFGASFAAQTGLPAISAAGIAVGTLAFLGLLYYGLFFWFSDATPGMRFARVGLCTFDDENPTRRAVRRRLGAMLLSACPLGLGFAIAALDDQRLTWHDRITKTYLRSY